MSRPFRVQVQAPGTPPILVDGTFNQEQLLPPWVATLLRALSLILRNLPAVIFLAVLLPLAIRLGLPLVGSNRGGRTGLFFDYTGALARPFRAIDLEEWFPDVLWDQVPLEPRIVAGLVGWIIIWLLVLIAIRLFRR